MITAHKDGNSYLIPVDNLGQVMIGKSNDYIKVRMEVIIDSFREKGWDAEFVSGFVKVTIPDNWKTIELSSPNELS